LTVSDGEHIGRGECVPAARYNQSPDSVLAQIESIQGDKNLSRQSLQDLLPAGAARNALDCALWDLEAKTSGKRAWELANIPIVPEIETSFTISLDTPGEMGAAASGAAFAQGFGVPRILKLKLGGDERDLARSGVRDAFAHRRK
jgi:L-alanine-DL-glutamate epimerase-like enolase superfamily enzyme